MVHIIQGPTEKARQALDPQKAFDLMMSDLMIDVMVKHTYEEMSIRSLNYKEQKSTSATTCRMEIKALLGLKISSGSLQNNHLNTQDLFDHSLCRTTYISAMGREWFKFLINCLCFNDKKNRKEVRGRTKTRLFQLEEFWKNSFSTVNIPTKLDLM